MKSVEVQKKGFHERFHVDSHGRRWNLVQEGRLCPDVPSDHQWNQNRLFWTCAVCGGKEPVKYEHLIHDEVTVRDPTEQLDTHSCDLERVRQVMED